MDTETKKDALTFAKTQLTEITDFWLKFGKDKQAGGYLTCLGRSGQPYSRIKPCMWSHGRIIWSFAKLYNKLQPNDQYLEMAGHGIDFALEYGFDTQGRPFYAIDEQNRPLRYDTDIFSELSYVLGFAQYAHATQNDETASKAWLIFDNVWKRINSDDNTDKLHRLRLHGHSMITLNVLQELRLIDNRPAIETMIDRCLDLMLNYHTKPELHATFELVEMDGTPAPGHWGRWINPGHMIEGGIFTIHEAIHRNDDDLRKKGLDLIDWGYTWGWDKQLGGIFNDVDQKNLPMVEHASLGPMKLWWQHAEAFYGLLLAYHLTQNDKFKHQWQTLKTYIEQNFIDKEQGGEWFGVLDRSGKRLDDSKGTHRKNIFHIARNLLWTIQLCR